MRRILGETPFDDRHELGRDVRAQRGDRLRLGVDDRRHRLHGGVALERTAAGDHLVDERAEGELIRAEIDEPADDLLRGHVAGRADDAERIRQAGLERRIIGGRRRCARLADAEVHDLRAAVLGQHDVARLQIAVHDPGGVRDCQAIGDLAGDLDRSRGFEPFRLERGVERLTHDQLHHDEWPAVHVADVVDGDDVGVVQEGRQLRFAHQAFRRGAIGRELVRDELDRDQPAQTRVPRLIDLAHAARSKGADDFVGADALTRIQAHVRCEHTPILSGSSARVPCASGGGGAI